MNKKLLLKIALVDPKHIGVNRKLREQRSALEQQSLEVVSAEFRADGLYVGDKRISALSPKAPLFRKISEFKLVWWLSAQPAKHFLGAVIRGQRVTPITILLLYFVSKKSATVIFDFPVYPYDAGYPIFSVSTLLDRVLRRTLKIFVTAALYNGQSTDRIFGIPATQCWDGYGQHDAPSLDNVKPAHQPVSKSKALNMVAVANFEKWHGIDRLILGLAAIRDSLSANVAIHLVGDGSVTASYKRLVITNQLSTMVHFHGALKGPSLGGLLEKCDLAIGSLALHRIGIAEIAPLKPAEYAWYGLPFIASYADPRFQARDFVLQVPADDSKIDLEKVLEWYENLNSTPRAIAGFARANLGWDSYARLVLKLLTSPNGEIENGKPR